MGKPHILLLIIITAMLWSTSSQASWFGNNDDQQRQQIDRLNGQLDQAQQSNNEKGDIIIILGVGCVVTLVIGAAIGSKARKAADERRQ